MSDPSGNRPSWWKLYSAVQEGAAGGEPQAQAVWARGKLIVKVLLWAFALNMLGSCAILLIRPEKWLVPADATIKREEGKAVATASMVLDPTMNPVNLTYTATVSGEDSYDYSVTITDPQGRLVAKAGGFDFPGSTIPTHPLARFKVKQAGPHEIRFEWARQPERLQSLTFQGRSRVGDSYFLGITFLLGVAAWGAHRWWRRHLAEPWCARHAPGLLPVAVEPALAPPAPVATTTAAALPPGTGSVFSEPFAPPPAPAPLLFRLGARLFLWFVSLGISMLWLPIAGCYLLFALLGVMVVVGGVSLVGGRGIIDAVMTAPETEQVVHYLVAQVSGRSALEVMSYLGSIAFAILLPFHLILVVVRAIAHRGKDPAPPSFPARFKVLFRWNVVIYAGLVLLSLFGGSFNAFLDTLVGALILVGSVFVPATVVLGVTTWMEGIIESGHKALA